MMNAELTDLFSIPHSSFNIAMKTIIIGLGNPILTDDGVGVPEELGRRSGLLNLAERAGRYAGSCTITRRATGGSVLSWRVPLG